MPGVKDQLVGAGYGLGWSVICRMPESWARWAFRAAADIPTLPVIVRALGVIGVRASAPTTGYSSRVRNGRSALSMAV